MSLIGNTWISQGSSLEVKPLQHCAKAIVLLQMVSVDYEGQVFIELYEKTGQDGRGTGWGWEWDISAFTPAVRHLYPLDCHPDLGVLGKGINGRVY